MYWADSGADRIQRADLDGSDVEDLITTGLDRPEDIAIDPVANRMYWTMAGGQMADINRAHLDGSGVEPLVSGLNGVEGISLGSPFPAPGTLPALGSSGTALLCAGLLATTVWCLRKQPPASRRYAGSARTRFPNADPAPRSNCAGRGRSVG